MKQKFKSEGWVQSPGRVYNFRFKKGAEPQCSYFNAPKDPKTSIEYYLGRYGRYPTREELLEKAGIEPEDNELKVPFLRAARELGWKPYNKSEQKDVLTAELEKFTQKAIKEKFKGVNNDEERPFFQEKIQEATGDQLEKLLKKQKSKK